MSFRTNASKAQESFSLKAEGDYEIIVRTAETSVTQNGKDVINLTYVIRNDVPQEYQNGLIFHSIWKKKEPNEDDLSIEGFNFGQLIAIANAAQLPDGKEYPNLGAFLEELVGKPIKVHLYHNEYNGRTYEKVDAHFPTDFPKVKHKDKANQNSAARSSARQTSPAKAALSADSADDDDYPF